MKDKRGQDLSEDEVEALIVANIKGYDEIFTSDVIVGQCANPECNYPLCIGNTHYTSEYGDLCSVCIGLIEGLRFSRVSGHFMEAHRIWKQDPNKDEVIKPAFDGG